MAVSLGKYKLLRRIAVGGMAEIFLARIHGEAGFQRKVIIKKILPHYAGEPEFVRRLVDEGLLASRLTHGNIVQVLDLGRLGPDYFIAMEFVDGIDCRNLLSQLYEAEATVPVDIGVHILWQVSRALAYAHDKKSSRGEPLNIVHRDISPANVFVSWEGVVKLGDFGIAKASQRLSSHTMTGVLQGKFPYMSPEQARGEELEQTSDIFSFGILAYELLTQQRPFEGESDIMILARVKEARPRPIQELRPDLPPSFAAVIDTCFREDPGERYENGAALERALARVLQENGWVVAESDLAGFLAGLFGDRPGTVNKSDTAEEETGEVLEASPLDPYELRAGMPTPARRATPPPTEEFTMAAPQSDWRRRQQRRKRGWLAWLGVMAVLALLLLLDYTTTNWLLRPPRSATPETAGVLQPAAGAADVRGTVPRDVATQDRHIEQIAPGLQTDVVVQHEDVGRPDVVTGEVVGAPADSVLLDPRGPEVAAAGDIRPAEVRTLDIVADVVAPPEVTKPDPIARSATRLTVIPEDAQVFVNGKLLGGAPQTIALREGGRPTEVRLERAGYRSDTFTLRHPGPRKLGKRLEKLATGRLVLRYNPASATVLIDGRSVSSDGGLNIIEAELTAGSHTIIVRDGDLERTETITIQRDREWRGTIAVTP